MELEESIIITLVRQHEHLHNTSTRSYRNHTISGTIPDTVQRPIRNEYAIVRKESPVAKNLSNSPTLKQNGINPR